MGDTNVTLFSLLTPHLQLKRIAHPLLELSYANVKNVTGAIREALQVRVVIVLYDHLEHLYYILAPSDTSGFEVESCLACDMPICEATLRAKRPIVVRSSERFLLP